MTDSNGREAEFRDKLRSVQFGKPRSSKSFMESRWERDMPAYQRLRMNGLQPKQIDGCARIETEANSQLEVEMADVLKPLAVESGQTLKQLLPKVSEGMAMARDMDWAPKDSVDAAKKKSGARSA